MSKPAEQPELSQAVVVREEQPVAQSNHDKTLDFLELAIKEKADVGVIERMMAVRREINAERAKADYDAAMAAFQAECPKVLKSKDGAITAGGKVAYKYAAHEDIIEITGPCRQKHGFSHKIDTDDTNPGWVVALCKVTHRGGHSETSRVKLPIGQKTGVMSETQVYSAALTVAIRRVFCNAFGIVPAGEDMDGRLARTPAAGPSKLAAEPSVKDLARQLWNLLKDVRGPESNWKAANQWLWDNTVIEDTEEAPKFTAERFAEVLKKADAKLGGAR